MAEIDYVAGVVIGIDLAIQEEDAANGGERRRLWGDGWEERLEHGGCEGFEMARDFILGFGF
jgi:hypothetical protein